MSQPNKAGLLAMAFNRLNWATCERSGQPLAYPKVANATWTWGNIGTVPSGAAGAFAATDPAAALIDLVYALKSPTGSRAVSS